MDILKKFFPVAFGVKEKDSSTLIKSLVVHIIAFVIASVAIWAVGFITGWIPVVGTVVGWVLRLLGFIVDAYALIGIVVSVLNYCGVLKD